MKTNYDILIIGGGAAGFFTAINAAAFNPDLKIAILERGKEVLQKVKISGGGRCNVTHACFDPKELTQYYPRGAKELLGPFHQFSCGDTFEWFDQRNIPLKIEEDGRVFPESNTSQTIVDCFLNEAEKHHIDILKSQGVIDFYKEDDNWIIQTKTHQFTSAKLVIACGSSNKIWKLLEKNGHRIIPPTPSLFTFNSKDERLQDIPGVVIQNTEIEVIDTKLCSDGPILITHWGLSAPAILKLSAWGSKILAERNYKFDIKINFIGYAVENCREELNTLKKSLAKKSVFKYNQFNLPKRLWYKLVFAAGITETTKWADLNKNQLNALASQLTEAIFNIDGKSTFKEEFVTAGGVALKEINFKKMESKIQSNLFFAGEVINIDAVTGGFNFQNAWTTGYLVAKAIGG